MIEPTPPRRAFLADTALPHPRTVGWFGTTAVAIGGINQSLLRLANLRQAPQKNLLAAESQPG